MNRSCAQAGLLTTALLAAVAAAACDSPRTSQPANQSEHGPTASADTFAIKGKFPVGNGRSLAIDCGGRGTMTIILEVGFDVAGTTGRRWNMSLLRYRLSPRYRVCNYDRANLGQSDPAPKPRTTTDIADELDTLLKAAKVPGPYIMVGVSAGGLYVQHFAARHPDQVVAVLAMNPESHVDRFHPLLLPLLNDAGRDRELLYASGKGPDNTQGIDLVTSAKQIKADGPLRMPLTIMDSTNDCPADDTVCNKIYGQYTGIDRDLVAEAESGGRFITVKAGHDLYLDVPDQVVAEVDRLAAHPR